jgi:hypothetical protein
MKFASVFAVLPVFALVSVGCAHPQAVPVTTAAAAVPAPAPAPAPEPVAVAEAPAEPKADAPKAAAKPSDPLSFAALSAQLGDDDKISLDVNHTSEAPAGKGLNANGYTAVGAAHQVVETSTRYGGGDIKVSGGLTTSAVRDTVRGSAARLRACYEHGLTANPRLAGRVRVSFSVDERGEVSGVDAESDSIPADVLGCVKDAFSAMTFSAPKNPPAKVVYPVDFNKD